MDNSDATHTHKTQRAKPFHLASLSPVLLFLFLVACAPRPIPTSDATPTPRATPSIAAQTPATNAPTLPSPTIPLPEGGTITIGVIGNATLEMNVMPDIVQDAVFDSLLRVNPTNGALEPGLAESFQVSNDGLTISFRLRTGVKWHDGAPLTADDVVATINAFSSPSFRGRPITDFSNFVRATALDTQTVQLTFRDAYCPALASIGTLKILPRRIVGNSTFPKLTPAQMIGTGALKFISSNNTQFVLQRNAEYYRGAPPIDDWTIRVFNDATTLRDAFVAKQIDVMFNDAGTFQTIADAKTFAFDANEFIALMFNLDTITLNDPRVRQAITYALDRNVLLNDMSAQGILVDTSMLPTHWASPANLPRYSFDPAKAKQLLSDAGWRADSNGVLRKNNQLLRLELYTQADDPILEPLAFRIREMLANVGVQVVLQLDDRAGWVTHAFAHRFDLLLLSRKIPLDPDQRWYWQSDQNTPNDGFNFGSYANARVDALLNAALRVPGCDTNTRAAIYAEIHRTLVEDAPVAFLFAPKKSMMARERVLNLAPSSFAGAFWNLNAWRVRP